MKRPFLDAYRKFAAAGRLPLNGLCNSLSRQDRKLKAWQLIQPTRRDERELHRQDLSADYWASGLRPYDIKVLNALTPLRANILLLCACVNGEY